MEPKQTELNRCNGAHLTPVRTPHAMHVPTRGRFARRQRRHAGLETRGQASGAAHRSAAAHKKQQTAPLRGPRCSPRAGARIDEVRTAACGRRLRRQDGRFIHRVRFIHRARARATTHTTKALPPTPNSPRAHARTHTHACTRAPAHARAHTHTLARAQPGTRRSWRGW